MKKQTSSTTVILFAFIANLVIAILKFLVAFFTFSSAMLAEAIHSVADTLNQVFLLIGIKRGRREPDAIHPFGFSSELYFWSFIVAIMLFTLGAFFSIYKGIQKLIHPVEIEHVNYAFMVLIFAIIGESIAFYKAFQKINRERGNIKIIDYLRRTKKSELIVVFLEDLAAIAGLLRKPLQQFRNNKIMSLAIRVVHLRHQILQCTAGFNVAAECSKAVNQLDCVFPPKATNLLGVLV